MPGSEKAELNGLYVVVTIADNGVVHAWGEGPVHDPEGTKVEAFIGRARARSVAAEFRRDEKKRKAEGGTGSVQVRVTRVLGIEPTEIPTDLPV